MHKAYVDGACRPNPGVGAYGYVIYDPANRIVKAGNGSVGKNTTNTIAEYTAIIKAMEAAIRERIDCLVVYSDSQAVVRQLSGIHKIHNRDMRRLRLRVEFLAKQLEKVCYVFIPREMNGVADAIAAEFYRTAGSLMELKKIS